MSSDQLHLGILTTSQGSSEQLEAMGFDASVGDPEANWRILIDDLNARGGLAGRRVVPVFAYLDIATTTPAQDLQAACTRFTEDEPVYAAASDVIFDQAFASCLSDADVPLVYAAAGTDAQEYAELPLVSVASAPDLTREAALIADGLSAVGAFDGGTVTTPVRIGLLRVDLPAFERAARTLESRLVANGLELTSEAAVTPVNSGRYADLSAQIAAAVLQFRSDGVTHVLFLSINATEPVLFMRAAEGQAYEPTYGLTSRMAPSSLATLVSQSQIDDAVGVGWSPLTDVDEPQDPGDVPEQARCIETVREGGQALTSRLEQATAAFQCDELGLVEAVVPGVADGSGGAFVAARRALGDSFASSVTFRTWFTDQLMGAAAYRDLAYDTGCSCFTYTSDPAPIP